MAAAAETLPPLLVLQRGSQTAQAPVKDGCVNASALKPLGIMAYDPGEFPNRMDGHEHEASLLMGNSRIGAGAGRCCRRG